MNEGLLDVDENGINVGRRPTSGVQRGVEDRPLILDVGRLFYGGELLSVLCLVFAAEEE